MENLNLNGFLLREWGHYINDLFVSHTRLSSSQDELVWFATTNGVYTLKTSYIQINSMAQNFDIVWWLWVL